jgi:nucleotide-binding universal stress UspA family protein
MTVHSIVVAFDGSPESIAASTEAAEIARVQKARLTIVGVVSLVSRGFGVTLPTAEGVERTLEASRTALAAEKSRLEKLGVPGVETHLLEGDPVAGVVGFVDKNSIDLIVVGSRGLDALGRFFLGSVSDGILHYSKCSVLVVKTPPAGKKARS